MVVTLRRWSAPLMMAHGGPKGRVMGSKFENTQQALREYYAATSAAAAPATRCRCDICRPEGRLSLAAATAALPEGAKVAPYGSDLAIREPAGGIAAFVEPAVLTACERRQVRELAVVALRVMRMREETTAPIAPEIGGTREAWSRLLDHLDWLEGPPDPPVWEWGTRTARVRAAVRRLC